MQTCCETQQASHNHMADLRVRNLATSCTSLSPEDPEAGAPRITHVGKQGSEWASQAAGDQQGMPTLASLTRKPSLHPLSRTLATDG